MFCFFFPGGTRPCCGLVRDTQGVGVCRGLQEAASIPERVGGYHPDSCKLHHASAVRSDFISFFPTDKQRRVYGAQERAERRRAGEELRHQHDG